ncbi:MAG: ATP-binding protein [Bacteroidota bacterium]|nr:ATP-binding protein [Bacteroidota bacterium]
MHCWRKIKSYFLDGYEDYSFEIQQKIEYLFFFNIFAIAGVIIYYITRIFIPVEPFVIAGDICLFFFVAISLIAIRLKKIYAVTFSVIFIPLAVLFYNVLRYYAADQEISQTTIFSSLSFLLFGLLYLSLFSVRVNQLIFFTLISAATLVLNCLFLINSPFGFRYTHSAVLNLIGALVELGCGYVIATLILRFNVNMLKNNEKRLIQSSEHYSALFSNIKDAFGLVKIIKDDLGRPVNMMILEINKVAEDFLKLTRDEVVFRKFSDIIHADMTDFETSLTDFSNVALTGKELHKTIYSKHFEKWLYVHIFSPETNYCAVLIRDITAQVESDYELKRIQERNAALLEAIPDALMVCDKDGFIKTIKRAQIELLEDEQMFYTGIYITQASLSSELTQQLMNSIDEVLHSKKLKTMVLEIPSESGIVYAETRLMPFGDSEILILFRNLTSRILSEKALLIEKEKAEESDRLKMAFLSNMSHEIRTPMNAIIGFSDMLSLKDIDEKEQSDFIYQIKSNGALLLNLINDILDLSKIEAGELEMHYSKFDIHKILKDIYLNFENEKIIRKKSDIQILVEKQPDIKSILINADEYRLKQILFNLMGNALKFTKAGTITFGYNLKENEILFFVKDTGIGIPLDKQEIIFHRFRQVDDSNTRTFGGAGLGLTISRNLVEAMGGRIWVEMNEHKGSTFYFTLPLGGAKISYTDNTSSYQFRNTFNWKGKLILIIDSETTNYVVINHLLTKTGVSIEWASNDQVVLSKCFTRKPDLVIFDRDVKTVKNGNIESDLKHRYPELPIIALKSLKVSGNNDQPGGFIDAIIPKPIKTKTFLETINSFLVA